MKVYITYFFVSLFTSYMILFQLGVSAGFASYIPVIALLGSIILFVVANPVFVYNKRIGLYIGLVSCLLILPYMIFFIGGIISALITGTKINYIILIILIPPLLLIFGIYISIKEVLERKEVKEVYSSTNKVVKVILAAIPILLFILYPIYYGKYWI